MEEVHSLRGTSGGLQNCKTARFQPQIPKTALSLVTNVVRKLPSPKCHTKLEFLPNTAAKKMLENRVPPYWMKLQYRSFRSKIP